MTAEEDSKDCSKEHGSDCKICEGRGWILVPDGFSDQGTSATCPELKRLTEKQRPS